MNGLQRFAVRIYPRAWRERYGEEFDALLKEIDPDWRDQLNVIGSAMKMRFMSSGLWKLVIAISLFGALAAGVASLMIHDTCEIVTTMAVVGGQGNDQSISAVAPEKFAELVRNTLSQGSSSSLITLEGVELDQKLTQSPGAPSVFQVRFSFKDPLQAAPAMNEFFNRMITEGRLAARPDSAIYFQEMSMQLFTSKGTISMGAYKTVFGTIAVLLLCMVSVIALRLRRA